MTKPTKQSRTNKRLGTKSRAYKGQQNNIFTVHKVKVGRREES